MNQKPLVSVIIPIYNGEQWINDCFEAILKQDILENEEVELSVYNDASTDNTGKLLNRWKEKICNIKNLRIVISEGEGESKGVGFAKNEAVRQSFGEYLCFQDIDDVMLPGRISAQLKEAKNHPHAIVGCQVKRIPENSTPRFVSWANHLPQHLLTVQIYTSHGPTVLMPTWFFHREVFKKVGQFSEEGKGTPEDLLFFYSHLNGGGTVRRVDEVLLVYRYHPGCTTFSVSESCCSTAPSGFGVAHGVRCSHGNYTEHPISYWPGIKSKRSFVGFLSKFMAEVSKKWSIVGELLNAIIPNRLEAKKIGLVRNLL